MSHDSKTIQTQSVDSTLASRLMSGLNSAKEVVSNFNKAMKKKSTATTGRTETSYPNGDISH